MSILKDLNSLASQRRETKNSLAVNAAIRARETNQVKGYVRGYNAAAGLSLATSNGNPTAYQGISSFATLPNREAMIQKDSNTMDWI